MRIVSHLRDFLGANARFWVAVGPQNVTQDLSYGPTFRKDHTHRSAQSSGAARAAEPQRSNADSGFMGSIGAERNKKS